MSADTKLSKDTLLDEARQFIAEQQAGHSLVKQLADAVVSRTAERDRYKLAAEINASSNEVR